MLILRRKVGESVVAGNVTVTVSEIDGNYVALGFLAPREIPISRTEKSPVDVVRVLKATPARKLYEACRTLVDIEAAMEVCGYCHSDDVDHALHCPVGMAQAALAELDGVGEVASV